MSPSPFRPLGLRFEHHCPLPGTGQVLGIGEPCPRISWKLVDAPPNFKQHGYHLELRLDKSPTASPIYSQQIDSVSSSLTPWPALCPLKSGQGCHVRVRVLGGTSDSIPFWSEWSESSYVEAGLLSRLDWQSQWISSPALPDLNGPNPPNVFRKHFTVRSGVMRKARLYITAQGVYQITLNGKFISKDFMNPGWTCYQQRLTYQAYDLAGALSVGTNVLAVNLAEGWFTGRLSWGAGLRNVYGETTSLMCQMEIIYADNTSDTVVSDGNWEVTQGASTLAEIYDGEKCDGRMLEEVEKWVKGEASACQSQPAKANPSLLGKADLEAMDCGPMRRIQTIKPVKKIITASNNLILDFGQNLVGYVHIMHVQGNRGHTITLNHAEVLENGELGTRPLRTAKATDTYTLAGHPSGESWSPTFTFHGFRFVQISNWPRETRQDIAECIEAVVVHTDMAQTGEFQCTKPELNQLHSNITWSIRGNFTSLPTDCPQRDERLGWTGDIALSAPTAILLYDCSGLLKSWLKDVWIDQQALGGVPALVTPNILQTDPFWSKVPICAIWNDVVVLVPWALYMETGDLNSLASQYESMTAYLNAIPLDVAHTSLWSTTAFQLGDWLDPLAPPDEPHRSQTDAQLVANAFLVHTLSLMVKISSLLGKQSDCTRFTTWHAQSKSQFQALYTTSYGRLTSDSQTAYALAIVFDLLPTRQQTLNAGARLSYLVRRNNFLISTGFAGTPYVLEALVLTQQIQTAYRMLLETGCPSWLYPLGMGATTMWERWDSITPDGKVNPGEMTSFNHYVLGAVGSFLHERVGGLTCLEAGWKRCRAQPFIGGELKGAQVSHVALHGEIRIEWEIEEQKQEYPDRVFRMKVKVPVGTVMEIVLPRRPDVQEQSEQDIQTVESGDWAFELPFAPEYVWPPEPISWLPAGFVQD